MQMRILPVGLLVALAGCASTPATRPAPPPAPGALRLGVSAGVVQGLADENHTLPLAEWPLYEDTNLPVVKTPDELRQYVKTNPKFSAPDLTFYRVMVMKVEGKRSYVFFHSEAQALIIVPQ